MRNQINALALCVVFSLVTVPSCNAQGYLPLLSDRPAPGPGYDAVPPPDSLKRDGAQIAEPTENQKVTFDLGVIHSMIIPESWDADNGAGSAVRKFVKKEYFNNYLYSAVSLEASTPGVTALQPAELLNSAMKGRQLTDEEIYSLMNFPDKNFKPNDKTSATLLEINGKKVLLIECYYGNIGPCIFLADGRRLRPHISYLRGIVYIPVDASKMQTVSFDAQACGDISANRDIIEKAVKSIEWLK